MMPARRAVPRTSPFLASPARISASVSGSMTHGALGDRGAARSPPCRRRRPCWRRPMASRWVSSPMRLSPKQAERRVAAGDVRLPHQALADEEGADAGAADRRATSACVEMPLSPTTMRSRGIARRKLLAHRERDLEGAQVAVVDADQRRAELRARGRVRRGRGPRRARPCRDRAPSSISARAVVVDTLAMMTRMQSAPQARGLEDLIGLEQEILAQGRQAGRLRAPRRDIPAGPGTRARRSAPRGRSRRRLHRRGRGEAGRNRRGSGPSTGSPS